MQSKHRPLLGLILPALLLFVAACTGDQGPVGPGLETPAPLAVDGAAIDVHTHVMSPTLTKILGGVEPSTADDLIAVMDEANVQRAVVLGLGYFAELPEEATARAENDFTAGEVAKFPDRLIGFCGINPLVPWALDEIDRCLDDLGLVGLKLHLPGSRVDTTKEEHVAALTAVFDKADQRRLPVLMHVGNPIGLPLDADALTNLGTIIATHPNVRLVLAHCFSQTDDQHLELLVQGIDQGLFNEDHLFVETSACLKFYKDAPLAQRELIVWRLRKFGLDRVFFGSDYLRISPAETPVAALETLSQYPFTQEEIDLITSNDASAWLIGE